MEKTPSPSPAIAREVAVAACVRQLSKSERGQKVLSDLHKMLCNGGSGLDSGNVEALVKLIRVANEPENEGVVQGAIFAYRQP